MPPQIINVHNRPGDVAAEDLRGGTVIVIDLLRASTTICHALAAGATEIIPFLEVDETLAAAAKFDRDRVVLGGERSGGKIPGFDLGNSPSEYTPQTVGGRRLLITTTNGTRALHHARLARRVLVGAFVNLSAAAASVYEEPRVDILCAGTNGETTGEDILAAGALVQRLAEGQPSPVEKSHAAAQACRAWEAVVAAASAARCPLPNQVARALRETTGGRNLLGIGLDQDLVACAQIDKFHVVPEFDAQAGRITAH